MTSSGERIVEGDREIGHRTDCMLQETCAINGYSDATPAGILKHHLAAHYGLADNAIAKLVAGS